MSRYSHTALHNVNRPLGRHEFAISTPVNGHEALGFLAFVGFDGMFEKEARILTIDRCLRVVGPASLIRFVVGWKNCGRYRKVIAADGENSTAYFVSTKPDISMPVPRPPAPNVGK